MYLLNEEQRQIIDKVRHVADEGIAPYAKQADEEAKFPAESIKSLADAGLLGLTVPQDFGGMGQGLPGAVAALDEISQRCASTGMIYLMHLCGLACYNARPDVAGEQLKAAAKGEHLSTLAWSEKGSRSHFWAPVSRAESSNGHISVTAEKSWVTSAGIADGYVVSTGAAGKEGALESTLYLVLKDDENFTTAGFWDSLGLRGNASAPMRLAGTTIPASRALSEEGKGMDTMLGVVLPVFQLGNSALSVGICEAAVHATTGHLTGKRFEHLDSKLADLPNLRARLAQMRIETDRARAHLSSAVQAAVNGEPTAMLMVLESKAAAAESALQVTDLAMKACGGAAFSKHLNVERNFRDARAANVMAPTSDVLHDFIGKALCGMDLF
jgi:alkylation response protein AidB-like acyl-CoA dehydrogenase